MGKQKARKPSEASASHTPFRKKPLTGEFHRSGTSADAKVYDADRIALQRAQERKLAKSAGLRQRLFEYKKVLDQMKMEPSPYIRELTTKVRHDKDKVLRKARPELKRKWEATDAPSFVDERQRQLWRRREATQAALRQRLVQRQLDEQRRQKKLQERKQKSRRYGMRTKKGQPLMDVRVEDLLAKVQKSVGQA
eukprot:GGOE01049315.1.p1 GENE.GGOE01049315.1~~GGOE01049315.1.p1  ORF type:complete len:221 (-),score=85.22 GGOE01049315.1:229-810(-)